MSSPLTPAQLGNTVQRVWPLYAWLQAAAQASAGLTRLVEPSRVYRYTMQLPEVEGSEGGAWARLVIRPVQVGPVTRDEAWGGLLRQYAWLGVVEVNSVAPAGYDVQRTAEGVHYHLLHAWAGQRPTDAALASAAGLQAGTGVVSVASAIWRETVPTDPELDPDRQVWYSSAEYRTWLAPFGTVGA